MDRKEFLSMLGMSAASLSVFSCLGGCTKNTDSSSTSGPSNVDFTLDLFQAAYAALNTAGGYVYNSGVIVAKTKAGQYVAVQQICTHESNSIVYRGVLHAFIATAMGQRFPKAAPLTADPHQGR